MANYNVWNLDMWSDGDGGWTMNDRCFIGTMCLPSELPNDNGKKILEAVCRAGFLRTSDRRRLYVEEAGETGWEIVAKKDDLPLLMLEEVTG